MHLKTWKTCSRKTSSLRGTDLTCDAHHPPALKPWGGVTLWVHHRQVRPPHHSHPPTHPQLQPLARQPGPTEFLDQTCESRSDGKLFFNMQTNCRNHCSQGVASDLGQGNHIHHCHHKTGYSHPGDSDQEAQCGLPAVTKVCCLPGQDGPVGDRVALIISGLSGEGSVHQRAGVEGVRVGLLSRGCTWPK